MPRFEIRLATTASDREACFGIRRAVFVDEQQVPLELEMDEYDAPGAKCDHFLVRVGDQPVATGRLRLKGLYAKFERIATLPSARGSGAGRALMEFMQAHAAREYPRSAPFMNAQLSAVGFYERLGWVAEGEVFEEAGIPHRVMTLPV